MTRRLKTNATAKKMAPRRRDVLLILGAGAGATAAARLVGEAVAQGVRKDDKRKALYQANSPAIQIYYRVNRYPK